MPRRQREGVTVLRVEVANDACAPFFPRDGRERTQVRTHDDVTEAGLPVRERQRADYLVLDIPAENDVALREAFAFGGCKEVLRAHPLASVDAVEVAAPDFDGTQMVLLDEVGDALDVHRACLPPSSVGRIVPERRRPSAAV